jgi:antirestriction protein
MEKRRPQPDDLIERINEVTAATEQAPRITDVDRIALGIRRAEKRERIINHTTARIIAAQLHDGQGSALLDFATSGAIDKGRLLNELQGTYIQDDTPDEVKTWIEQFGRYVDRYDDRTPVDGWNDQYSYGPELDAEDCCTMCGAHFSEPHDPDCERSHEVEDDSPIEVFVLSLTDSNNGNHYGVWVDATLGPELMQEAVNFMLRNSYYPGAEEYVITDTSGFYGLPVDRTTDLRTIAAVAKGIEHQGEAYARWLEQMDPELQNVDEVSRQFNDYYQGKYDSISAYAEHILDAGDYNRVVEEALQLIPEHLRQNYVRLDVEHYAEWLKTQVNIAEAEDGGIYVFNL